jgi:segregation and condensation protein B
MTQRDGSTSIAEPRASEPTALDVAPLGDATFDAERDIGADVERDDDGADDLDALEGADAALDADPAAAALDAELADTDLDAEPDDDDAASEGGASDGTDATDVVTRLEALLFVSDGPVSDRLLARVLEQTPRRVGAALDVLAEVLQGRGLRLQRGPEGAQLVTAPAAAEAVEALLGIEGRRRLSAAAMETLAIVAYRQPVTRGQIESIRGVSSEAGVATLRARELIVEVGRAPGPGRPVLFGTTQRFLGQFGLEHPRQLPPLPAEMLADLPPLAEEDASQLTLDEGDGEGLGAPPPAKADVVPLPAEADVASPPLG